MACISTAVGATGSLALGEISQALAAYRPQYQLVREAREDRSGGNMTSWLQFDDYPFTRSEMPYCSINLINLGVEQALILHLDHEVSIGKRQGFWHSLADFRALIQSGHGLVAHMETRVLDLVPLRKRLALSTRIGRARASLSRYLFRFEAVSEGLIRCSGTGLLTRDLRRGY